jgi:heavy metal sensor kinase
MAYHAKTRNQMAIKINSLRFRFALWVSGFLLASLILFGTYVYVSMSRSLHAAVDDALRTSATQARGTLNAANGQIILAHNLSEDNSEIEALRARGLTVRFLNAGGILLGGFGLDWERPLASPSRALQAAFSTTTDEGGEPDSRVYTLPVMDKNLLVGYVQTSQSLDPVLLTLERLQLSLILGIPLLTLLAALGGYVLAGRALKPMDEITNTSRRISAQDLAARINLPDHGDELGRLASTFDAMLARLEDSFRRERQFTSDASHELRTPLAAMQTIIGVTRARKRSVPEYERALDDLGEETSRLRTLAEDLLVVARAEASTLIHSERVDLSSLLADVADSLAPLAETKRITLECHVQPNLALTGDRDDLIRLFFNLVDNAIKFTEAGGVVISAQRDSDVIHVKVLDTGKGIAAADLGHVFDRFFRADPSRTQAGAGLGLAIAQKIVREHGGDISLTSEIGVGTTCSVTVSSLQPHFM